MDQGRQTIFVAWDPNIKYGPEGVIEAGQNLDYRVEYENEGEGIAFGVYFTDTQDEDLDDSTLEIGPVYDVDTGDEVAPPGTYDPQTRTITWTVGEVGPGQGGYSDFSINVREDAPKGTEVINYATIYFPSVPQVEPTNAIVSYIPFEPSIDSLGPTSGIEGSLVTIKGEHFGSARVGSYVSFGETQCSGDDYLYWTDSRVVIVLVPEGASGVVDVTVTTEGGTSNAKGFTVNNPLPASTSISPESKTAGEGDFTLTVNGTGFIPDSVVKWDGADKNTAYESATQLTASILASDIATAGTVQVTVFNPAPGGGTSNAQTFTVEPPAPTVTSITPSSGNRGQTLNDVSIAGTNFRDVAMTVRLERGAETITGTDVQWVSATQVTADFAIPSDATVASDWDVYLRHSDDGKSGTLEDAFEVQHAFEVHPAPTVTSITPSSGNRGQTLNGVSIAGTDFYGTPTVWLRRAGQPDINATNVVVVSPTQITCDIQIPADAAPGARDVYVQNPQGKSGRKAGAFTVEHAAPTVTSISPENGPPGPLVTIKGSNFGSSRGTARGETGGASAYVAFGGVPSTEYPSWSDTKIEAVVPEGASQGPVTVVTSAGSSNTDKTFTVNYPTWYLAEGTTAWGFNTYITVENPNDEQLTAKITYMDPTAPASGKGIITTRTVTLPPESQTTIDPCWDLGDTDFSTKVECLEGKSIAADRTMFWTGPGAPSEEAHSSIGVTSPSNIWYLPEGSSAWNFETWTLVENPNPTEAKVTLTYMIEGGQARSFEKTVPAYSRATYNMYADLQEQADASIEVSSKTPVIAERSMYRNNRREGSCSIGTTAPANNFYLAEGTTAWGFTTYVLVQNPNNETTDVTVNYMTPDGAVKQPAFTIPANSRKTIRVNDVSPANGYPIDVSNTDFSIQVTGTKPIIAERAMYWGAGTPLGEACHASIGMASPHTTFYLPDGQTENGYETWTLVQNPNSSDVTVNITYFSPTGQGNVTKSETIPANSRRTFSMLQHSGIKGRAAIMVQSTDPSKKIMVERAMYWNNRGAGTDTIGGYSD